MSENGEAQRDAPMLRVVHGGDPGPEALAALVVAVSARAVSTAEPPRRRSGWADRGAMLRRPLEHGPGRWVASGRRWR
ncbi:MAG TPA: acyl-CoA carboxylase subunit epsilon [Mycobacteriales bacterium]|nr:acyl-CoA carboxylase subunit epsilon [Mycobacteriales bacterium]